MTQDEWGSGKEVQSNWFKFEAVGDRIKGTLLKKYLKPSNQPSFPDQWVYELRTAEGVVFNIGISVGKEGTVSRLNNCKLGEIIGILYEKDGEVKSKGFAPAKFLKVLTFGMDPDYNKDEEDFADGEEAALPDM